MEAQAAREIHLACPRRSELLEITNAMVRIYKDQFGRGPTKARTRYADADTIISSLEDTLTPPERKLQELGEHERLGNTRMFFQRACRKDFTNAVEQITGRTVRAFVSGVDPGQDVSAEVFYLHPVA